MKCICGYSHESGIDDKGQWQNFICGDEEFIRIKGSIFEIESEESWESDIKIRLFACPKCKTVKMARKYES